MSFSSHTNWAASRLARRCPSELASLTVFANNTSVTRAGRKCFSRFGCDCGACWEHRTSTSTSFAESEKSRTLGQTFRLACAERNSPVCRPIPTEHHLTDSFAEAVFSRTFFFSYAARAAKNFPRFPYDQSLMASRIGARLQPSSEMLYSTFGGTVG